MLNGKREMASSDVKKAEALIKLFVVFVASHASCDSELLSGYQGNKITLNEGVEQVQYHVIRLNMYKTMNQIICISGF